MNLHKTKLPYKRQTINEAPPGAVPLLAIAAAFWTVVVFASGVAFGVLVMR